MKKTLFIIAITCFCAIFSIYAQTNLLAGWDGNGATGTGSEPSNFGWNATPAVTWGTANGGNNRYVDPGNSEYKDYTFEGAAYNQNRILWIRFNNNEKFTYQFSGLEAGKSYNFSLKYGWHNNGNVPNATIGVYSKSDNALIRESAAFAANSTKRTLKTGEMYFVVPSDMQATDYYLSVQNNANGDCMLVLADLEIKETAAKLFCASSAISLNYLEPEAEIYIYPNGSSDAITLTAPEGIVLTPATLPATGGAVVVSSENKDDASGVIEITQGSDKITLPVSANFITISTIADEGAWCWFADPRALHYENESGTINSTYIGYIDVHGAIKATQINHLNNTRSEVLIRSYFQPDDHNNPTFLVLPDERIMLFYSRHTDEACFYYRVSQQPGDITTLGAEIRLATANNTTYPSPFILEDDPEHIYLCWRGIGWHPTIARMPVPTKATNDVVDFNWGPYQILRSKNGASGVRPYAKYASNGKDKIYLTYTTTHPDNQTNNWIYFNTIDINTKKLQDIDGNTLATVGSGTLHDIDATSAYLNAHPKAVVDNTTLRGWVWQVAMDNEGKPVIAMVRISSDKTSHDYYYAKWTGSEWRKTFLENGGGHFHQTSGLEMCYSGGMAIDNANANIIYCSVPVTGQNGKVYEIKKYTLNDDATLISTEQITFNSKKNNSRPYVIAGANGKSKLAWMYGDYYDWIVSKTRPLGYPTSIRAGFEIPEETIDLDAGLLMHDNFDNATGFTGDATAYGGVLSVSASKKATIALSDAGAFTVVVSPYVNHNNYNGEIFNVGNLIIGINKDARPKPYVKVGDETYTSCNTLGSSDVWQTQDRGTGGNWPSPTKFKFFSLALTYENGVLKTFINGLIDQYIEVDNLSLSDITLGGFEGYINDLYVYNRVLLQDEIKTLSTALANEVNGKEGELEFSALSLPRDIYSDIVLKTAVSTGNTITWTTSNAAVLSNSGIVTFPEQLTEVTLTASVNISGVEPRTFTVNVHPRDIENNLLLCYQFEAMDIHADDNVKYVRDKSGNGNDAIVYGSAQVNGVLDLSANTLTGFATNGYAAAPNGVLNDLRSYTFAMKINPRNLEKQPRIYDFGTASSNSVFARLNGFCTGIKYNGETTVMLNSSTALQTNRETFVAFTFDAKTKTTKIYVDGVETASGTNITKEPYMVAAMGANNRNYIGRTQWWDTSEANNNADYCGTIDDFYLYNIALTKAEIERLPQVETSLNRTDANPIPVYPNPVKKDAPFTIQGDFSSNVKIEIFNIKGQLEQTVCASSQSFVINHNLTQGFYLLKITDGTNRIVQGKLLVE